MNYCGNCEHYIGCGDWNLCCSIKHPTKGEREQGITYPFGHLCYEDTLSCDEFKIKQDKSHLTNEKNYDMLASQAGVIQNYIKERVT